jgi:hypothetical protein
MTPPFDIIDVLTGYSALGITLQCDDSSLINNIFEGSH